MPIRFACRICAAKLEVTDAQAGAWCSCTHCGRRLRVPTLGAQALPDVQPTGRVGVIRLALAATVFVAALLLAGAVPRTALLVCLGVGGVSAFALLAPRPHPFLLAALNFGTVTTRLRLALLLGCAILVGSFAAVRVVGERQVATANRLAAAKTRQAQAAADDGRFAEAERLLTEVLAVPRADDTAAAESLLADIRRKQAVRQRLAAEEEAVNLLLGAERAVEEKRVAEAAQLLRQYVAHPHATAKGRAEQVLAEIEVATSDTQALRTLEGMTDDQFVEWEQKGRPAVGPPVNNPALAALYRETLGRNAAEAKRRREEARLARLALAEKERREAEELKRREAEERAKREAEAGRKVIPYAIIKREELGTAKLAFDVRVDLIDGRLPSADELLAVAQDIHSKEKRRHENNFIDFHRPGKHGGTVCFATGHHLPPVIQMLPEDPTAEPLPAATRQKVEAAYNATVKRSPKVAKSELEFQGGGVYVRIDLARGATERDAIALATAYYKAAPLRDVFHDVTVWDSAGQQLGFAENEEDGKVYWEPLDLKRERQRIR